MNDHLSNIMRAMEDSLSVKQLILNNKANVIYENNGKELF